MKFSKLYITLILSTGNILNVDAQVVVPTPGMGNTATEKPGKPAIPKNWEHLSFGKDSVYGVELNKAYIEFPKAASKKKIIVAIMDSGIDTAHEDLKNVLWVNKKEIAGNGKDDDGNGYVDDVHGWNFLGTKDGRTNIIATNLEADREFMKLRGKYEGINLQDYLSNPIYVYYRAVVTKSAIGSKEKAVEIVKALAAANEAILKRMQDENPSKILRLSDYVVFKPADSMQVFAHSALLTAVAFNKVSDTTHLLPYAAKMFGNMVVANEKEFEQAKIKGRDNRDLMDDKSNENSTRFYGNNAIFLPHSEHGTHVSSIIGAQRGNGLGTDGIADNVELMMIRVVPDGDEYDKDIANGIRYAVDNGAKIINMSFGKTISPEKKWVDEAINYAQKKGVLIIKAAGNDATDLDKTTYFPSALMLDRTMANNLVMVGASTPEGKAASFSNYGKSTVDLFAPGTEIYAAVPGNKYANKQGTSMACPVTAGVAAMVWSRFPRLTYLQLKDILLKSVTKVSGTTQLPGGGKSTIVPFSSLSATGGIVNAVEALRLAKSY
ncbi:peptidase S8 [Pedobacter frigidisoli]|uniref:Peptidase S8 n=1 Tax=Pedobacter frigidisoli TaxID=2530455 RepID=A0A4R0P9Z2_9SPHI|nr:S8 family serine peptidase [Pedobacter frigidisoli]TCD11607.1 peptidase S8 [Pedobacter frigidisoli]